MTNLNSSGSTTTDNASEGRAYSKLREIRVFASAQAQNVKTLSDAKEHLRHISHTCDAVFGKGPLADKTPNSSRTSSTEADLNHPPISAGSPVSTVSPTQFVAAVETACANLALAQSDSALRNLIQAHAQCDISQASASVLSLHYYVGSVTRQAASSHLQYASARALTSIRAALPSLLGRPENSK
jgi:hypothetical protein